MKPQFKKALTLIVLMVIPFFLKAQDKVPMADVMRSNGKIYVVVAVVVIIFIGILLFLISLDNKLRKFEKKDE